MLCTLLTLMSPSVARAQPAGTEPSPFTYTVGGYFGTSQHAAAGHLWGLTADRKHYFAGIHADVPMVERRYWTFNWAPEVVPLLVVTNNPLYRLAKSADTGRSQWIQDGRAPVAGVAMAPIGLEADVTLKPRVQAFANGALGCVWFTRQTPVLFSRVFNFTAEFGGGVRLRVDERVWMRLGYKFHHFSNAHTAPQNPGVDAHVFFVGFDRIIRRPRKASALKL